MTTVRTIDNHASTTAACSSSSKEVAELTNVWAIHSMPVETIATGWTTTAEVVVVAAAAVPTMTISRASEDASKLGISHRYTTNSLCFARRPRGRTRARVDLIIFEPLSALPPPARSSIGLAVRGPTGGNGLLAFFSWQQTSWRKPTSHTRYNEVNCIDLRRVSPRIIVTQFLHTYSLRTLFYKPWKKQQFSMTREIQHTFEKTVSWKTNGTNQFSTRGGASFRNVRKVDSWAPFAVTQLLNDVQTY